ncbi:MAG: hypothetical protein ABJA50_04150 [Chloroflexota bacterium]
MLQLAKDCATGFRRHAAAGGVGLALGFLLGLSAPSIGAFVSFGPLLMIILCLVPCLAPLLLLRKSDRWAVTALPATPVAAPITEASDPQQAI